MRGARPPVEADGASLSEAPPMPVTCPGGMEDTWRVTCSDLARRGLLTVAVLPLVETYVGALWMARQCRKSIEQHGVAVTAADGQLKPHPAAGALAKAQETIARLGDDLGLSTVSRSRPGVRAALRLIDDDDSAGLGL